jgi:hypothetical protein
VTDRDDALRRELGWTGPEESDFEPSTPKPDPGPPLKPPVPSRPPVDFVAPEPPRPPADAAREEERKPPRVPPAPEPGPRGGQPDAPPPPFLDPERPGWQFPSTAVPVRPAAGIAARHRAIARRQRPR